VEWLPCTSEGKFFASHAQFLKKVCEVHGAHWWIWSEGVIGWILIWSDLIFLETEIYWPYCCWSPAVLVSHIPQTFMSVITYLYVCGQSNKKRDWFELETGFIITWLLGYIEMKILKKLYLSKYNSS
jgi:hypothetical protein